MFSLIKKLIIFLLFFGIPASGSESSPLPTPFQVWTTSFWADQSSSSSGTSSFQPSIHLELFNVPRTSVGFSQGITYNISQQVFDDLKQYNAFLTEGQNVYSNSTASEGQKKLVYNPIVTKHEQSLKSSNPADINKLHAATQELCTKTKSALDSSDKALQNCMKGIMSKYMDTRPTSSTTVSFDTILNAMPQKTQAEYYARYNEALTLQAQHLAHEHCLALENKMIADHKATMQLVGDLQHVQHANNALAKAGFINEKLNHAVQKTKKEYGTRISTIQEKLSADVQALLKHCNTSSEKFETMIGNTLQAYLHKENMQVLVEQAALFKDNHNEQVGAYIDATVKSCAVTQDAIKNGKPQEAIAASKLTGVLHEATKLEAAIGKGLLSGTATGVVNTVLTGALIALCPEAGCLVLAQKIYDYVYFIQETSHMLNDQLTQSASNYQALSLDQRAEQGSFYISLFLAPFASKSLSSIRFVEMISGMSKAIKTEYAALRSYVTLDQKFTVLYKGLRFPQAHEASLTQLINSGKITTQKQVDQFVQVVSGPITYLNSKCAEGILSSKPANTSPAVMASQVAHEATILKELQAWQSSIGERTSLLPSGGGITIKEFSSKMIKDYWSHIFSPSHIKNGILKLGNNKPDIMNKLIDKIVTADSRGLLSEKDNHIETIINSVNVTIKAFIKDGKVISIDGYVGYTNRMIPKIIKL